MASSLPWHPLLTSKSPNRIFCRPNFNPIPFVASTRAFKRNDLDGFVKRVATGELWRDAWRRANDGFEQFIYDTRKTAERLDRRYTVTRRLLLVAQSAADRARELDREFDITQKWRTFSMDFISNLPKHKRQLRNFLDTPLGRSIATFLFVWFAMSGWLFRVLILATWVLPFAGPLLIGAVANNVVIKGECPACRRPFVGYKNQSVRCVGCGSMVWQPQADFFSGGGGRRASTSPSNSQPDIIDVEFEER